MNRSRNVFTVFLLLAWMAICILAPPRILQVSDAALLQAQQTDEAYQAYLASSHPFPVVEVVTVIVIVSLIALWRKELSDIIKRLASEWTGILMVGVVAVAACQPVSIVSKEPNETLYKVPVVGSTADQQQITNAQFENAEQVNTTEIEVPRDWVCTNYLAGICTGGHYRPSLRIYVVNTAPVTQNWITFENAPPVESSESAGFSVPIIISAYLSESDEVIAGSQRFDENGTPIEGTGVTCQSASTYLSIYGRKVDVDNIEQIEVESRPLADVLNVEVKGAVTRELAARFSLIPIGEAVAQKARILDEVLGVIRPAFAQEGVCIRSFGTASGLLYDDEGYQLQINEAANRSLDEDAARANATTTAIYAGASAQSTQIAVQAVATQRALERESIVQQAAANATAVVIEAKAAADAQELMGQAIANNPDLIQYQFAQLWNGGCTTNCFGDTSGVVPFYNVNPQQQPGS